MLKCPLNSESSDQICSFQLGFYRVPKTFKLVLAQDLHIWTHSPQQTPAYLLLCALPSPLPLQCPLLPLEQHLLDLFKQLFLQQCQPTHQGLPKVLAQLSHTAQQHTVNAHQTVTVILPVAVPHVTHGNTVTIQQVQQLQGCGCHNNCGGKMSVTNNSSGSVSSCQAPLLFAGHQMSAARQVFSGPPPLFQLANLCSSSYLP